MAEQKKRNGERARAFVVQDGAVQHPIKGGMVSGITFEWPKQVTDVSKDATPFGNAIVPSLRVENVKVVGS